MSNLANRALVSQLVDDLTWLEEYCRHQPDRDAHAVRLRLAAALVRNCLGPFLNDQPPVPLHVAVLGGAGAGKSTVVNMLCGSVVAESNPQAGFTRHPVAYTSLSGVLTWLGHVGFLGPLQRLPQPGPASIDADVYQVRRIPEQAPGYDLVKDMVIWDCPDMTTWAATGYVPRLLEVAGLADVLVYVASDERYNDEIPTQLFQLFLKTGKPAVVCLMKVREAEADALLVHFQQEVLSKLPGGVVSCLAIPYLTPEQLADPAHRAAKHRITLLNQVAVLGNAPVTRRQVVRGAVGYLLNNQERLLATAREDLSALQGWRTVVQQGQVEMDQRYYREYLTSEKYHRFDEALIRLLDLLELPGVGKIVSGALWVARTPYRLVKGLFAKTFTRPEAPTLPEEPLLREAFKSWLDLLRKEATRRADSHPLWAHIAAGFATGNLAELAQERFQQGFRGFQMSLAAETDRTARSIYEELQKTPAVLNTLRGSKLALDLAAIGGAIATGGQHWQLDFILVPVYASVSQWLVETLGKQYVDTQRETARQRQQSLMAQYLSAPLAEWLAQWPATGGSSFERLQLALRRIPESLIELDTAVRQALAAAG